jgi:hypothetical protein
MPASAPPVADELSAIEAYLVQQQDAFRAVAYGLTDAQAATTPTPSALSVGSLVKHVTACQDGWLDLVLAAPGRHEDRRSQEAQAAQYEEQFRFDPTDSLTEALAAFDDVCRRVLDAVRTVDLGSPVPVPPAPWYPQDLDAWSVRWVWFHLIEELARHAGHADIVREAVDGATMYELIAGVEGWPATPWLTPWQPAGTVSA